MECLRLRLQRTPIDILADAFLHLQQDVTAKRILDAYDGFLGILSDDVSRKRLKALDSENYESDEVFESARKLSHEFRDGLIDLFFDNKSEIFQLTKNYGVF